jgi:hypothetical protein
MGNGAGGDAAWDWQGNQTQSVASWARSLLTIPAPDGLKPYWTFSVSFPSITGFFTPVHVKTMTTLPFNKSEIPIDVPFRKVLNTFPTDWVCNLHLIYS